MSDQPVPHPETQNPWYQAAQLMQPALIRLLDQLRKALESSPWQGSYETVEVWPENGDGHGTDISSTDSGEQPQILYWLHLKRSPDELKINLWELCYQICFRDYEPDWQRADIRDFQVGEVEVDASLFDTSGEVDWNRLDGKTERIVKDLFADLPPSMEPRSDG
ncbi:hypothetical protein L3556_06685 [Candidatus Synechococcus calcipolaris G9]|uniref:YbjN domain-containing protein n=1 Tax=Candidatus Synechococcus calcipolaris G9 TaxID=1497997 RepID=A0ABT6EYX6_9SYNE|nr:hypothetical protein [Candidatus Synechococcus calcipolaris]MDG2990621.1 hypothetical protein [Candidatus Synechococcus calcipolaris G9]